MNNWRLVSELNAYVILGTTDIYLAASEKKSYSSAILNLFMGDEYYEVHLYENNFKIKLDGLNVYINSPELPPGNDWYLVKNFWTTGIGDFIKYYTIVNGNFEEDIKFEAIFCSDYPESCNLISIHHPQYNECLEEMERRLNCEICKKTKVWVPGHRYDTVEKSVYYLFPINTHRRCLEHSDYIEDKNEVYLCLETSPGDCKTISEVLRRFPFSKFQIYYSKFMGVDSGEYLENDYTEYQDYLEDLVKNSENDDIKTFLDIFSIGKISPGDTLKSMISEKIKQSLYDILIKNWGITKYRSDLTIGDTVKDNNENLEKIFLTSYIKDKNLNKLQYYRTLFEKLDIPLRMIVEESILTWKANNLKENFETYLQNIKYYQIRCNNPISKQRTKTAKYKTSDCNNTLHDLFGDGPLRNTIIELLQYAEYTSCGYGVTEFYKMNVGTKRNPLHYITAKVTLEDIIKFKKGVSKMPENLKNDILRWEFVSVVVIFDENEKIE